MIHYQLRCAEAHEFDGWFSGSAAFEKQAKHGLVECPTCGSTAVERALMTPAVATRDAPSPAAVEPQPAPPASAAPKAMAGKVPAHVLAMLQRMRAEVEKNCDYVGPSFADEARRMHRGETDKRGIYGESTPDEAQSLAEEGIDVSHIPWVPRADG
jgi:hypothetical protein